MTVVEIDILIIGTGIAGLSTALGVSRDSARQVVVITRADDPTMGNTQYAQGGIVTLGPGDSSRLLVEDILRAGAGLSAVSTAEIVAEEGPRLVHQLLIEQAHVPFARTPRRHA